MTEQEPIQLPRQAELSANQVAFLVAFAQVGEIIAAANSIGMSRWCHHYWRKNLYKERNPAGHEAYAEAWEFAKAIGHQVMVAEGFRRGVVGTQKFKFHDGKPLMWTNPETGLEEHYCEREYSDWMLGRMLEAHMPEQFSTKHQHQHTGQVEIKRVILEGE